MLKIKGYCKRGSTSLLSTSSSGLIGSKIDRNDCNQSYKLIILPYSRCNLYAMQMSGIVSKMLSMFGSLQHPH